MTKYYLTYGIVLILALIISYYFEGRLKGKHIYDSRDKSDFSASRLVFLFWPIALIVIILGGPVVLIVFGLNWLIDKYQLSLFPKITEKIMDYGEYSVTKKPKLKKTKNKYQCSECGCKIVEALT